MVQSDVVRGEEEKANQRRCRHRQRRQRRQHRRHRPNPRGTESKLSFLLCVPFLDLSNCNEGDESIVVVSWSTSLLLQVLLVEEEGEEMVVEDGLVDLDRWWSHVVAYSMEHSMNHLTK